MSKTRYLWAAALLALLVGLTAGSALAAVGWTPTAETIPDAMVWDQTASVTIDTENTGDVDWASTFDIVSVDTPSGLPIVKVNRWGVDDVLIAGPVEHTSTALAGLYTWAFDIIAPPIASIAYPAPVGPYTAAAPLPLACKWVLADGGVPFDVTPAGHDVAVGRFVDVLNPANAWCAAQIQQLAGLCPKPIVGGYDPTHYAPATPVTRDQMAVFIVRATGLPTAPPSGKFVDVPPEFWASPQIEGMVTAGLVGGYDPTHYLPAVVVRRDQMAMFIARGMLLSTTIPSGPPTPTFVDVPISDIAYNSVEYCKANHVVGGYDPTHYAPAVEVTRDQMAVFIYRAFLQPNPCVIVLAGPGTTNVDAFTYDGFSTITQNPTGAYVGFDVIRMGDAGPVVKFEVKQGATVIDSSTVDLGDVTAKKTAAAASGNPYVYAWYTLPALGDGDYTLVTTVDGAELARKVNFSVGAVTPPTPDTLVVYPSYHQTAQDGGTITSGDVSDLTADDTNYVVIDSDTDGSGGALWYCATTITPAEILKMRMDWVARISNKDAGTLDLATSGHSMTVGTMTFTANDTDTTVTYESANKAKFVDLFHYGPDTLTDHFVVRVLISRATPAVTSTLSVDMIKTTFTLR